VLKSVDSLDSTANLKFGTLPGEVDPVMDAAKAGRSATVPASQPQARGTSAKPQAMPTDANAPTASLPSNVSFGRPGALVLWSESSVPFLVEEDAVARARLAAVLGPKDLLLFGGVAVVRDRYGAVVSLTNSLFVIDAKGQLHGRYDKAHLVPLGEYVPARALMTALGVARLAPGDLDFKPGPGPQTLKLPGFLPVGVQICYEIIFPGAVVDAANRPAWIANISNDAWFGPSGPPQHLAQARLRAIEEGLPIARATPTGISAMIDAHGRVVTSLPAGARDVASAPLPAALPPTLFARFGQLVPALFGAVLLLAGALFDRRRVVLPVDPK
jgi:apolipoprotein N-acyltransferase